MNNDKMFYIKYKDRKIYYSFTDKVWYYEDDLVVFGSEDIGEVKKFLNCKSEK